MKYQAQILLIFLFLVCISQTCFAASPPQDVFLVPFSPTVSAGQQVRFSLFIPAYSFSEFEGTLQDARQDTRKHPLDIIIKDNKKHYIIPAVPVAGEKIPVPVAGKDLSVNTYIRQTYEFDLPRDMEGMLTLSLKKFSCVSSILQVNSVSMPKKAEQMSVQEKWDMPHALLSGFSWYEPAYFLVGVNPGIDYSKFQFSFKYRLFNNLHPEIPSWKDRWYFAYTQTSYWDLKSDSMPFEDSSYKPEIFYWFPKIDLAIPWISTFGLRTGLRHESNGKDGEDSRSTNTMYLESVMEFPLGREWILELKPRAWFYVKNEDESNPDLYKYRGYFSLGLGLGNPDGLMLNTCTAFAEKGETFMADISFPLARIHESLSFFFHVQYVNGYAERLISYREKDEILRIGLSIIR